MNISWYLSEVVVFILRLNAVVVGIYNTRNAGVDLVLKIKWPTSIAAIRDELIVIIDFFFLFNLTNKGGGLPSFPLQCLIAAYTCVT